MLFVKSGSEKINVVKISVQHLVEWQYKVLCCVSDFSPRVQPGHWKEFVHSDSHFPFWWSLSWRKSRVWSLEIKWSVLQPCHYLLFILYMAKGLWTPEHYTHSWQLNMLICCYNSQKKIEMKDKLSYSPLGVQRYLCLAVETCPVFLLHYHVRQISAIRVMILQETLSSCGEQ